MSIAHEAEPEKTEAALWNVGLGSALRRELPGVATCKLHRKLVAALLSAIQSIAFQGH